VGRGVVRDAAIKGVRKQFCPVLKVARQCPLVLLVEVNLGDDKHLRSKEVKF
jgi:hypothetical protein